MSKETTFKYLVNRKVEDALLPEVTSIGFRLEQLAEEMIEAKDPQHNKIRLEEIIDCAVHIRMLADKLHR